jgi:DNA-binding NtrC family response regulator
MTLDEMEKRMIIESLKRYNSNMSIISVKLGITRQTLYNKMKKYDL